MAETITADALRQRLDKGERLTVLDVREAEDYAEWRVPGAVPCDAYASLAAGDAGPVKTVELPHDRPVVAVCYEGVTSAIAAQALRERGFDAVSLSGGMAEWTLAWNVAEVALPGAAAHVLQVRRTGKGCLSYVVGSAGECVVIDPCLDARIYVDLARERGWRIVAAMDTHVQADHLSRAPAVATATGARLVLPRSERWSAPHEPVDDGARVRVGEMELVAMRTPGHTPESTCYHLEGHALFTGDTLFADGIGRPDLVVGAQQARSRAVALHASLARLFALPHETRVLPGHASAPVAFDHRPVMATLRQAQARVPFAKFPRDAFVERILERLPATPANHRLIVRANEEGAPLPADPKALEAGANRCAIG